MATPTGGCEAAAVDAPRDWRARFRVEPATTEWSDCRVLDVTLNGAALELGDDDALADAAIGAPCLLQIDSIAEDDVGIVMQAVVCGMREGDAGRLVLDVEFSARREERLLLHLLVRLHALV